ncbi:hypothetical protein [Mesorhizobium sp.]|uniref:hypothetical protein n=1 Tax=Mesorhizobium sp. TaxID=1871066 RepID=UPI0025EC9BF0|nr:hypothetical protein [Mesorhizobium sp.]
MKAEDFGRSLPHGLGVNLLVTDMAGMVAFCRDVLDAQIIYADEDFAAIELLGSIFMLHADHSYLDNAMSGVIAGAETRGAGIELRLYGADPDAVEKGRRLWATLCLPARSTSRMACASATSSVRTVMSSCPARGCKPEISRGYGPDSRPGSAAETVCDKFATPAPKTLF